ncbi:MAG: hypothetical protein Q4G33_03835 [bacterium]|nr:hypothetical protein [bacterium]
MKGLVDLYMEITDDEKELATAHILESKKLRMAAMHMRKSPITMLL